MKKPKKQTLAIEGTAVSVVSSPDGDYICLTDMLKAKDGEFFISDWLRNRNTVEFLGIWESVFNPGFNYGEFAAIRSQAGLNSYKISVKEWVQKTNAIGIKATTGRYGGTYAHPDIAFEFGMWISPEFKIYLVKEFRRLKDDENDRLQLGWNLQRTLAKINYRIHTDAIRETLIPPAVSKAQATAIYASEADLLNVALFGQTARQWRDTHPDADGNIRDHAPNRATRRPHQSRNHQFRPHPLEPARARAPAEAQQNRHHPDAHAPRRTRRPNAGKTVQALIIASACLRFASAHPSTFQVLTSSRLRPRPRPRKLRAPLANSASEREVEPVSRKSIKKHLTAHMNNSSINQHFP